MTLPNFIEFEPFNRLRRLMDAPLPDNFSSGYVMNRLTRDDLDKALEALKVSPLTTLTTSSPCRTGRLPIRIAVYFSISGTSGLLRDKISSRIFLNFI
jgi:hypothetical protein